MVFKKKELVAPPAPKPDYIPAEGGYHLPELAHHYTRSNNPAKAMDFLQRAGSQAMQRSAYPAAIEHLSGG